MCRAAIDIAENSGQAVYIVVPDRSMISHIEDQLWRLHADFRQLGIKIKTPRTLGPEFSLDHAWVPGAHPNCVFLCDHTLFEDRLKKVTKEIEHLRQQQARMIWGCHMWGHVPTLGNETAFQRALKNYFFGPRD
jgi:hypothetical protein